MERALGNLPTLMNREVLDKWCERGILASVLAILVVGPLGMGAARPLPFLIIQGLTLLALGLWGVRLWAQEKPRLLWPPVCWAVLAFVGYAIGRYLTADIEYVARQELIRILVYASLFLILLNNAHRQEPIQIISFTLIGLGAVLAFLAIYQVLTGSHRVWNEMSPYVKRGIGTYISPNHLAGFLEMLLPLALALTFVGRAKHVTKIVLGYCALVMMAGLASTVSRGGWVASLVAVLLFFAFLVFHRTYRLPSLVFIAVMIGVVVICFPRDRTTQMRLKNIVPETQSAAEEESRLAIWRSAWRMWQDYPWCGVGPAHFDQRFWNYRPEAVQGVAIYVHNDYLNTLVDWGVVGGVLVLSALGLTAWGVKKTWRHVRISQADLGGKSGSNKFALVLGGTLGLVAIGVHSFVDFNMHIPANAILAVTLIAIVSSHLRFATDDYWVSMRWWGQLLASLLLLGAIGYLGWQEERRAHEQFWLNRANQALTCSPEQIADLQHAFEVEPQNAATAYRIGEAYQAVGREGSEFYGEFGGKDYRQLTTLAMEWLARSQKLNPWHSYSVLLQGMCLDWLNQYDAAAPFFDRAELLDPNGSDCMNQIGIHYFESGDYAAALPWFERSARLMWQSNQIAHSYIPIANRLLLQKATNVVGSRAVGME